MSEEKSSSVLKKTKKKGFVLGKSGNPNGRPRGSKQKMMMDVLALCESHNFNPLVELIKIASGAILQDPNLSDDMKKYYSLRLKMEASSEILKYCAPQLKAVDQNVISNDDSYTFNVIINKKNELKKVKSASDD